MRPQSLSCCRLHSASVHLDRAVDSPHEEEGGECANGPRQEHEQGGNDEHVAEVQQCGDDLVDLKARAEVQNRVQEHVQRRRAAGEERCPPPSVVLRCQLEVRQGDGDLRTGHEQDHEHQCQKPEEVVELVQPNGRHNEEELGEDSAEGENATHQRGEERLREPRLLRNGSRNRADLHRQLNGRLAEACVRSEEDQRDGHAEPEHEQREHGGEWHRSRGLHPPDAEVQEEEDREEQPGIQESSH
mmetsp:Transcript_12082/g.33980  ORF Transcript_12082/g.33980 Transcript_12082/m.33980 type:complete len:244 (-) Transcript_12082:461-1192(-)